MSTSYAQEAIPLPITLTDPGIIWDRGEREFHSTVWETAVVTNVQVPVLIPYLPSGDHVSGTAVIICPGGGLYGLSIASEGTQVAEWLAARGVAAFVLKYRLVPTGEDGTKDIMNDGDRVQVNARQVLPLAISDALHAIDHVRQNAQQYQVSSDQIGIMGFSAGGAVTMGATYNYDASTRPDFVAPIYAWMDVLPPTPVPGDAPSIFVACASDDPLHLAPASVQIYSEWLDKGKKAELHMYARGGHGFGMKTQGVPSDQWIQHFGEWLKGEGLMDMD